MSDESALDPPVAPPIDPPVADEPAGSLRRLRGGLSGYLRPRPAPHAGDLVAVVQDARSGKAVADATVEVLTPRDALVTTLGATDGEARSQMKEGPYRLRVTHPRFAPEVRQIQVIAGQTTEVRVRLAPRSAKALR